jgi:hypothetical protein
MKIRIPFPIVAHKPVRLCLLCAAFVAGAGAAEGALDIWLPRQHVPAFVQPGSNFVAEVRGASSLPVGGWSASISNELRSWTCTVSTPTYGSIHQGEENGWRVPISVPADAPPELFTLVLANTTGGATNRVRAVKVLQNSEEDFYLLQISDQHVTLDKAVVPGGNADATWGNGSTDAIHWAAPVINLINPRFVLVTGDNNQIFNAVSNWCGFGEATNRVKRFHTAIQSFVPPTVVIEGNHDVGYDNFQYNTQWREAYEDLVGQRAFSYRMGSFYMLACQYPAHEYLTWARNDYNAAYHDSTLKYRLITSHFLDSTTQVAYSTNACNLMLAGHKHDTEVYQSTPYPILLVETFQNHGKAAFFNFHRTTSGWTCAQVATHANGVNVWPLFGDWGSNAAVSATFTRTNNGAQTSNTVSIVNALPQDFYNGRLKFLMTRGAYTVSNGTVEAQYDYNNGASTAVLVKMTIRSNATTTVSIQPAASPPQIMNDVQTPFLVMPGGTVSNSVTVTGSMSLRYQWKFNGVNLTNTDRITGSQTNSLSISSARASDAGTYQVTITNSYGSVTSSPATLLLGSLPVSFNGTGPGWASNGSAEMTGSDLLTLTDPSGAGGLGSFFFQYPQFIGAFKAAFTYRAGGNLLADGATFCLQNDARGWTALGGNGGNLGVSGITPSVELELNLYNGGGQVRGYTVLTNGLTGLRGTNGNYHPLGSVNLNSGDPIDISVLYGNGQMALSFTDALAHTSFRTNLTLGDLTQVLGDDTAYIGFTGAYGGSTAVQTISNFNFVSLPMAAIQLNGPQAVISWPGVIAGYHVQQNGELATPNWLNVTNPDTLTNGLHQVIVPAESMTAFYRLILLTP